ERLLEARALLLDLSDLFLGHFEIALARGHLFEIAEPREALLDGREIGERPSQPALVDVAHPRATRFFGDGLLRLALGPDEKDVSTLRRHLLDEHERLPAELHGFLEVDDVDAVARAEDVLLHLWIPSAGLVAEVGAG